MSHRPRTRFGQNFLHDPAVIDRIVHAIAPQAGDHLVEIGPGQGAITAPLLARAGRLDAVEIDRDLAASLTQRFADEARFRLHLADALAFDFCGLENRSAALRVVGNLPYNISTPLLFHLLDQVRCIADIHVTLQKEVVERMSATPGNKQYGRLTVMLAARCRVEKLFDIGSGAFRPAPRVTSAFARLTPHTVAPFVVDDAGAFAAVVSRAFSMRRKTLRRSLGEWFTADDFKTLSIDSAARPETLSPAQFALLGNRHAQTCRAGNGL